MTTTRYQSEKDTSGYSLTGFIKGGRDGERETKCIEIGEGE
jgi:hypothetical protein